MQFTNPPRRLSASLYQEATAAYIARVGSRALAIYRVGAFRHPGLSDIDLLVIPKAARFDNDAWFAARHALPRHLRAPFRSDPSVVAADGVDVLRFTTHRNRVLLHGADLAESVVCEETLEQRWSMLFERLCQFDRVARQMRSRSRLDLSSLVSKTKSVGYSLVDLDFLTGSSVSAAFRFDVEDLRERFFDMKTDEAGARTWQLFERGMAVLDGTLDTALPLSAAQRPSDFGRAFLRGEAQIAGLNQERLSERRSAVARSQQQVRALGFRKGDVFVRTPYAERVAALNRRTLPGLPLRLLADAAYRARGGVIHRKQRR